MKSTLFKIIIISVLVISFYSIWTFFSAKSIASSKKKIIVFAAASLTESFRSISEVFEQLYPECEIILNFAGSKRLLVQLSHGAYADIFASGGLDEMDTADQEGLLVLDSVRVFVQNKLVIIYPRESLKEFNSLYDLAVPGLKIDIGDQSVPVGRYTHQMLNNVSQSGFREKVYNNVVSREENVKAVVSKVRFGEVDAGIVYTSDLTEDVYSDVKVIEIPEKYNQIGSFPVAIMNGSSNKKGAENYIRFLLSEKGQNMMMEHGFIPVGKD